jgi:hypothetical protein
MRLKKLIFSRAYRFISQYQNKHTYGKLPRQPSAGRQVTRTETPDRMKNIGQQFMADDPVKTAVNRVALFVREIEVAVPGDQPHCQGRGTGGQARKCA